MDEKSEHIIRAEHFKAGWESGEEAERERIIALLSDDDTLHDIWWIIYRDKQLSQWAIAEVLKDRLGLINGENK